MIKMNVLKVINNLGLLIKKYNWIKNKYLLTSLFFLIWLCFIDEHNFINQYKLFNQLKQLENRKHKLQMQVDELKKEIKDNKENPNLLEKYARENYLMKKDNETIFIYYDK